MTSTSAATWRRVRKPVLGATGLLCFLVVWQSVPALGLVDREYLPYVTDVAQRLAREVADLAFWRRLGLTMQAWSIGLAIAAESVAPMHLLEPKRLVRDEGLFGAVRFVWNVLRNRSARQRVFRMRRVFREYRDHLAAIMLVGRKQEE